MSIPSRSAAATFVSIYAVCVGLPFFTGWTAPGHLLELAGLALAAMLASCLRVAGRRRRRTARSCRRRSSSSSASLMLARRARGDVRRRGGGADAGLRHPRGRRASQALIDTGVVVVAIAERGPGASVAGAARCRRLLCGRGWPCRSSPRSSRITSTQGALGDVIVPLVARRPVDRSWPKRALAGFARVPARRRRRDRAGRSDRSAAVEHRAGAGRARSGSAIAPTPTTCTGSTSSIGAAR